MKMCLKAYTEENRKEIIRGINEGKIFVYPADTIYGLGCDATNSESVRKIREIKKRNEKPFSVIAPNVEWIMENCDIIKCADAKNWIRKLPGAYTLILPLKNKDAVAKEVLGESENIGVRVINNWFYDIMKEANTPFVTTSVNLADEPYMTDFYSFNPFIKEQVDYFIYEGAKNGKPSIIVNLTGEKEKIIERN